MFRNLAYFLVFMSLLGCSNISTKHVPPLSDGEKRKLFLFLDGTVVKGVRVRLN
jgi:hypothetical protein